MEVDRRLVEIGAKAINRYWNRRNDDYKQADAFWNAHSDDAVNNRDDCLAQVTPVVEAVLLEVRRRMIDSIDRFIKCVPGMGGDDLTEPRRAIAEQIVIRALRGE